MHWDKKSRRMFLQGLGGTMLAIPFLPSLVYKALGARPPGVRLRYINLIHGHGCVDDAHLYPYASQLWDPASGFDGMTEGRGLGFLMNPRHIMPDGFHALSPQQQSALIRLYTANRIPNIVSAAGNTSEGHGYDYRRANMTDYANAVLHSGNRGFSEIFDQGFNSVLPYMNVLRGIDYTVYRGHHQGRSVFGDTGDHVGSPSSGPEYQQIASPTIDQVIAHSPGFGTNTPYVSLSFGSFERRSAWVDGAGNVVPVEDDYYTNFNRAFQELVVTTSGTERAEIQARPVASLNKVYRDGMSFRGRLSRDDRNTFDEYMESINSIVTNPNFLGLNFGSGEQLASGELCGNPTVPMTESISEGNANSYPNAYNSGPVQRERIFRDMASLTLALVKCDATRVINIGVSPAVAELANVTGLVDSQGRPTDVVVPIGDYHQSVYHTTGGNSGLEYHQRQAILVSNLKRVADHLFLPILEGLNETDPASTNGETYLYNSLVHWTSESSSVHNSASIPTFLAGNAGGNITSNQYIDYRHYGRAIGEYHSIAVGQNNDLPWIPGVLMNRLWISILRAMGVPSTEFMQTRVSLNADPEGFGSPPSAGGPTRTFRTFGHVFQTEGGFFRNSFGARQLEVEVVGPEDHFVTRNPLFESNPNVNLDKALIGLHPPEANINDDAA